MNCLLVDDEPGIREGLATLLRLRGFEVRTAGDLALAQTLLGDHEFDVVVTDWRLPDGTAASLYEAVACPVVVVSGHPEEVEPSPMIALVMAKPVLPERLIEVLKAVTAEDDESPEPEPCSLDDLPLDVREVATQACDALAPVPARLVDDGAFVTLTADWPGDWLLPELEPLGGDLRVLVRGGAPRLELRWCRDGRPDPSLPTASAGDPWPDAEESCVDFDDSEIDVAEFRRCCELAAERRDAGAVVHFLNVPRELIAAMEGSGRKAAMPMRETIGPRLPAVLTDLWN